MSIRRSSSNPGSQTCFQAPARPNAHPTVRLRAFSTQQHAQESLLVGDVEAERGWRHGIPRHDVHEALQFRAPEYLQTRADKAKDGDRINMSSALILLLSPKERERISLQEFKSADSSFRGRRTGTASQPRRVQFNKADSPLMISRVAARARSMAAPWPCSPLMPESTRGGRVYMLYRLAARASLEKKGARFLRMARRYSARRCDAIPGLEIHHLAASARPETRKMYHLTANAQRRIFSLCFGSGGVDCLLMLVLDADVTVGDGYLVAACVRITPASSSTGVQAGSFQLVHDAGRLTPPSNPQVRIGYLPVLDSRVESPSRRLDLQFSAEKSSGSENERYD
ncbi:hypothetical protein DFH06DRAFT_1124338 [Mycena polygramma]|nr:hypothetical protein DFH06DRAFT_1124338 [Mycena polygramma]